MDKPDIPGLSDEDLVAITSTENPGTKVEHEPSSLIFLKLSRLQTLRMNELEAGEVPALEDLKQQAKITKCTVASAMLQSVGLREDSTRRVMMLERLMVEVVRECIPTECDRLNVEYYIDMNEGLMSRPIWCGKPSD